MSDSRAMDERRRCYTLQEVAAMLGISERTIRRQIQKGKFPPPLKIGNRCLIRRDEFEALLEKKASER